MVSVTKDDVPIEFDVRRIKVTVKEHIETDEFPIVKLKQMTKAEIEKFLGITQNETKINLKRKNDSPIIYMTRSKLRKLSEDMELSSSVTVPVSKNFNANVKLTKSEIAKNKKSSEITQNVMKINMKRKSDFPMVFETRSKLRKLSEDMEQPPSVAVPGSESEIAKYTEISVARQKDIGKAERPHSENSSNSCNTNVAKFQFSLNEIIWGKIRGSAHWPAKVINIKPIRNTTQYEVVWMNDYRKTKLFHSQMYKFHSNFDEFSAKCSTAVKEALIYLSRTKNLS